MTPPNTRVQMKHLSVPQNQTTYFKKNVFTENLLDLLIISLIAKKECASHYNRNHLNFQELSVNRLEL